MILEQPVINYNGSPQIEDGYTRIANELLEAVIAYNFTSRQLCVIFCIIRATYGFNKKSDAISGWQIAKMTNISRQHISTTIKELEEKKVLIRHAEGRKSHGVLVNELSINKYYDTWITVNKSVTVTKSYRQQNGYTTVTKPFTVTVNEMVTQPSMKQDTHKDIPKDNKDNKDIGVKNSPTITFKKFYESCKAKKETMISDNDPIFEFSMKAKIPDEFIHIAWNEFKSQYMESTKRYKDWRSVFRNCVRGNWFKIWFTDINGDVVLTGQGRTLQNVHKAAA